MHSGLVMVIAVSDCTIVKRSEIWLPAGPDSDYVSVSTIYQA